ncbi:unnamed protein product [Symbiodinium natans]|uniref:Uncharacterized protein n=1 Tax=Symbiodinium natans TaxID=878477 RepID=A0A812L8Y8_9DINO|nr:unnamed protein product [Symbiodinium natans]
MMAEDGRGRCAGDESFDMANDAFADAGHGANASSLHQRSPAVISLLSGRTGGELEYFLRVFWVPAAVFATAEMLTFLVRRASFFVVLTDNAFEVGPTYSKVVEVHVWASIVMWCLAAVQILGEQLRRRRDLAWIHRLAGKVMLLLFFFVVLPTSLYLSALQRIDILAPAVAAVLLDTAFCTTFFLYRGWRVVRRRASSKSLMVHGKLMQCGTMMSMAILPQRFLQLYLTMQLKNRHQANYSISILVTSILFFVFGHFQEGPRGFIWMNCIGMDNAEEAFGSRHASAVERWSWKLRWLAYVPIYYAMRFALQ